MDSPASPTKSHVSNALESPQRPRLRRSCSRASIFTTSTAVNEGPFSSPSKKLTKLFEGIRLKSGNQDKEHVTHDYSPKTWGRNVMKSLNSIRSRGGPNNDENQAKSNVRSRTISPLKSRAGNANTTTSSPKRRKSVGDLFANLRGTISRASFSKQEAIQQQESLDKDLLKVDIPKAPVIAVAKRLSSIFTKPKPAANEPVIVNDTPDNAQLSPTPTAVNSQEEDIRPKTPDSYLEQLIESYCDFELAQKPQELPSSIIEQISANVFYKPYGQFDRSSHLDLATVIECREVEPHFHEEPQGAMPDDLQAKVGSTVTQIKETLWHINSQELQPTLEGIDPFSEDEWKSLWESAAKNHDHSHTQLSRAKNPPTTFEEDLVGDVVENKSICHSPVWAPYNTFSGKGKEKEILPCPKEAAGKPVLSLVDLDPKFLRRLKERNERYATLDAIPEKGKYGKPGCVESRIAKGIQLTVARMTENFHPGQLNASSSAFPVLNQKYSGKRGDGCSSQSSRRGSTPPTSDSESEDEMSPRYSFKKDLKDVIDSIMRGYDKMVETKRSRFLKDFPSESDVCKDSTLSDKFLEQSWNLRAPIELDVCLKQEGATVIRQAGLYDRKEEVPGIEEQGSIFNDEIFFKDEVGSSYWGSDYSGSEGDPDLLSVQKILQGEAAAHDVCTPRSIRLGECRAKNPKRHFSGNDNGEGSSISYTIELGGYHIDSPTLDLQSEPWNVWADYTVNHEVQGYLGKGKEVDRSHLSQPQGQGPTCLKAEEMKIAAKSGKVTLPQVTVQPPTPLKPVEKNTDDLSFENSHFMREFLKSTNWRPSTSRLFVPTMSDETDSIGFTRHSPRNSENETISVVSEDLRSDLNEEGLELSRVSSDGSVIVQAGEEEEVGGTLIEGPPAWYKFL